MKSRSKEDDQKRLNHYINDGYKGNWVYSNRFIIGELLKYLSFHCLSKDTKLPIWDEFATNYFEKIKNRRGLNRERIETLIQEINEINSQQ